MEWRGGVGEPNFASRVKAFAFLGSGYRARTESEVSRFNGLDTDHSCKTSRCLRVCPPTRARGVWA